MKHFVKILPRFFQAVIDGRKPFEIRENDRDYKTGDLVMLQEFIERVHYPECPYENAENKYISYPEEIERCEFENSDTCRARHSCKEYTEDKYSGRRCLVKIKEIFDISFIAPNYIAFTFDIVRKNC